MTITNNRHMGALNTFALFAYVLTLGVEYAYGFDVCLLNSPGFVFCDASQPSTDYTGFDVELFRNIAQYVGYAENPNLPFNSSSALTQYKFTCIEVPNFPNAMAALVSNSSRAACMITIGMITINTERLDMGVRFSHSYYHTGLRIMVYSDPVEWDAWSFVKPFEWETWLALALTVFLVPMLVWLIERLNTGLQVNFNRDCLDDLRRATYKTLLSVAHLDVQPVVSWVSQLVILALSFLLLVMLCTYTASLASLYTTNSIDTTPQRLEDLSGKSVATSSIYQRVLNENYGLSTSVIEWSGAPAFLQARQALANNTIQAYIMAEVALTINMGIYNTDCKLRLAGGLFQPFSYGFAYNLLAPSEMIDLIDVGMLWAQESHRASVLSDQFLSTDSYEKCGARSSHPVEFHQVAGLWYILAAVLGLAVAITLLMVVVCPRKSIAQSVTSIASDQRKRSMEQISSGNHAPPSKLLTGSTLHVNALDGPTSDV